MAAVIVEIISDAVLAVCQFALVMQMVHHGKQDRTSGEGVRQEKTGKKRIISPYLPKKGGDGR